MAWVETRGKRHRGGYRDAAGRKRYTEWGASKREVRALAQEEEAKIRNGTWVDPSAGKILFSDYFENQWVVNRVVEENTIANYWSHYNASLKDAFGDTEVKKITAGAIQRWVARIEKEGVKPRTIQDRFVVLQTVLAARKGVSAVRDKLILSNPCAGITLPVVDPRVVDVYSVEECNQILEALDPWWRPLPLLASETGMRWGELMGLKVSDFENDFAVLNVRRTIVELTGAGGERFRYKERPKGKKPRRFALTPEAAAAMRQLVKERRLFPGDRVFSMPGKDGLPKRTERWPEGVPVSRHYHRQMVWSRVHLSTGVKQRRLHDLRGSHISWLLAGGADVSAVMMRVGIEQLSTVKKYQDALADADERALEALAVTKSRAAKREA